jgi:hypothetical protein
MGDSPRPAVLAVPDDLVLLAVLDEEAVPEPCHRIGPNPGDREEDR